MNVRNFVSLEVVKNERPYSFLIPYNSPYEEAAEVLGEMVAGLKEMQRMELERIEQEKSAAKPEEVEATLVDKEE